MTAFERMPSTEKGFVYDEVKRRMADENLFVAESDSATATRAVGGLGRRKGGRGSGRRAGVDRPRVLQVHDSYVIAEDADGVLIIDQHALHERVMFETIQKRILGDGADLESQRMLMPAVIDADAARVALLDDAAPLLARLGIEAAAMGPAAIGLHAFPSLLLSRGVEPAAFLDGLLGKIEDGDLSGDAGRARERSGVAPGAGHDELQGRGEGGRPADGRGA